MRFNVRKINAKELFIRTVQLDMKKLDTIDMKECCNRITRFMLLIVVVVYIGYQIGRDAANRDRRNSMKIEKIK